MAKSQNVPAANNENAQVIEKVKVGVDATFTVKGIEVTQNMECEVEKGPNQLRQFIGKVANLLFRLQKRATINVNFQGIAIEFAYKPSQSPVIAVGQVAAALVNAGYDPITENDDLLVAIEEGQATENYNQIGDSVLRILGAQAWTGGTTATMVNGLKRAISAKNEGFKGNSLAQKESLERMKALSLVNAKKMVALPAPSQS